MHVHGGTWAQERHVHGGTWAQARRKRAISSQPAL